MQTSLDTNGIPIETSRGRRNSAGAAALFMALLTLALGGCSSSLLGPEDAAHEDLCSIYMSEADATRMAEVLRERLTPEQVHRCRPITVYVVKFPG